MRNRKGFIPCVKLVSDEWLTMQSHPVACPDMEDHFRLSRKDPSGARSPPPQSLPSLLVQRAALPQAGGDSVQGRMETGVPVSSGTGET